MKHEFKQYIGGKLITGQGRVAQIVCPGNEEVVGEVPLCTKEQAQQALEAAQKAFPVWSKMSLEERGEWIIKLRDAIVAEQDKILDLLCLETGKIREQAAGEMPDLIDTFSYNLEVAKCNYDETVRDTTGACLNLVMRQPLGVVVGYLAWNFPMHNLSAKIGPVLASGCTAVLKPATKTPMSTLYIGEIMKRIGFPAGVINFIAGDASEIGVELNSSPIPALLTLIGSSVGGAKLIKDSATSIKRFSLELGGNAPFIVTEYANLDDAASRCMSAQFFCASQNCAGPQRVLVHKKVYHEFLEKLVALGHDVRPGTCDEPDKNLGPMITRAAVERMQELVDDAVAKGGKVAVGGKSPEREKGFYYEPTVITGMQKNMRIYSEEVFGPIVGVMSFETLDEAIEIANDTEYGLYSYIWTHKIDEVYRLTKELRFGTVNVNGGCDGVHIPHGGIKESGIGKDGSRWSLDEYFYLKGARIHMDL